MKGTWASPPVLTRTREEEQGECGAQNAARGSQDVSSKVVYTVQHRVGRVLAFSPVVGIGTPPPFSRRRVYPPTLRSGGEGTLACGRGVGGVPIPTRGHPPRCSKYISTLCCTVYYSRLRCATLCIETQKKKVEVPVSIIIPVYSYNRCWQTNLSLQMLERRLLTKFIPSSFWYFVIKELNMRPESIVNRG